MLDLQPVNVPDDYDPSQHPLPEVASIDASAASDDDLEAKIAEYHANSPFLAVHHDWQKDQLRITEGRFTKVSESVVMIQTLLEAADATAPNQELFVEKELFNTSDEFDNTVDVITISGSTVSLAMSIWAMTRPVAEAGELAENAGKWARFKHATKGTKFVKATRILGAVGAVASLTTGIIGFINVRETQQRRRTYLESLTNDYKAWFGSTTANHNTFEGAKDELEAEIAALQLELGYPAGEAGYNQMCTDFAGNIELLGSLTARSASLTRLLCQQKDVPSMQQLSDAEVASILRLPVSTVASRRAAINLNPGICATTRAA